jgi:predicted transcriptional regulator
MSEPTFLPTQDETEAERDRRLAWEREAIAHALAEADAGLVVDSAEVDRWLDSLGTDQELPMPEPKRPPVR